MKQKSKFLLLILGIAVIISVFAISTSAASDGYTVAFDFGGSVSEVSVSELPTYSVGDYVEYKDGNLKASYRVSGVSQSQNRLTVTLDTHDARYYEISDASGNVSYVSSSDVTRENLGARFVSDMNALASGSTLKLLSDVHVKSSSVSVKAKTLYLDLNGFNLIFANERCGMGSAFGINTSSFYLYSSRPGANFFHSSPMASYTETKDEEGNVTGGYVTPTTPASYAVFEAGYGAKIYLGAFKDASGDNLSVYSNILVNAIGTYAEDEYSISIDGGYYNRYSAGKMSGMFYLRDSDYLGGYMNVSAKNATFNATARTFYCYSGASAAVGTKQFRIDAENCVFALGTAADKEPMYEGRMQANFKDCTFLSYPGSADIVNFDDGCTFVKEFEASLDDGYVFAKSLSSKTVSLKTNKFSFSNYVYDEASGAIYANFDFSSLDVTETTQKYYFETTAAKEENTSLITWVDHNGNATLERWLNGVTPSAPISLPTGNDVYNYTFGKLVPVNGDRTYTAKPVAKFGLKINLTLASDFIYNVYVPESAAESIKEVRVYKSNGEGVVLERGELATINGTPYYRYFFNIQASLAADAYSFDMDIYTDKESGEYFTQECEMSIPAYCAEIIYNEKYSDSTHDLMNKVLAYVKAACDYFKTSAQNKYYGVIGKIPSVTAPTVREGAPVQDISETTYLKNTLSSISVIFGSQLKYRFYFKSGVDFESTSVAFSYIINGAVTKVPVTNENINSDAKGRYYDVPLKASDMRSDVILSVNSESFTYNLSNYVYEVNLGSDNVAKQLVYSLWDYSLAAGSFNNETPDVDVSINGTPISDYKIVANTEEELLAAEAFRAVIAKEHGVNLEIVSSYNGKAIEFKSVSPDSENDFYASIVDENLVIECAYRSFFESAAEMYVRDVFCNSNTDINLTPDRVSSYKYGKILYSDFDVPTYNGTAEDFRGLSIAEIEAIGAENAFEALKRAHAAANKKGYDVYAEPGKVYYISETLTAAGKADTITIKTNTYWQGADFIIDDSNVSPNLNANLSSAHVFTLSSDNARVRLTELEAELQAAGGFSRDIKKLNTGLGYPAMLLVNNSSATHFIRFTTSTGKPSSYDKNGNPAGQEQHEYVIVDAEGNIDPSTPFLFDYDNVSSIYAYRIDDTPIVLDGGEGCFVTTLSSMVPLAEGEYKNISRNLYVSRNNATVKNVAHVIYNEPTVQKTGHTYSGFLYAGVAYNVEFNNCVVQSRVRCVEGTYDIGVYNAVDVRFINCTQSNFYRADGKTPNTSATWYVMGSNFCKNLVYDGCMLTRFDAHCGVYNATVKNSVTSSIRLTGGGHFLMENTTIIAVRDVESGFIELREDYGSTWRGTIELKDCTYINAYGTTKDTLYMISSIWVNHDFGYDTYLPNVIIDNFKLAQGHDSIKNIEIFQLANGAFSDNSNTLAPNGTYDEVDESGNRIPDFEEGLTVEDYRQSTLYHTDGTTKENVNPYTASEFITIKNNYAKYNYKAPSHIVFENTKFRELPLPFTNLDTPFIEYFPNN